jgi:hypothetical protein
MRTQFSEAQAAGRRISGRHLIWALALLSALAWAGAPPDRFAAAGISQDEAQSFLAKLQLAVQGNDARGVASMTRFPLTVNGRPGPRDPAQFAAAFLTIYNERVRAAVSHARVQDLFVSDRGVMIGSGQLWIAAICEDGATAQACADRHSLAIIAINNRDLTPGRPR